jgi:hypothetical protein
MGSARRAAALLLLLAAGGPARADAPGPVPAVKARAARAGGIASLGIGAQYAGLGLQLLYFQPVPLAPFGQPLAIFASAAYGTFATLDGRYTLDRMDQHLGGFSFMAGASAGRMHRACIGAGFAPLAGNGVTIEGLVVAQSKDYGPFVEAGYELLAGNGVFVRVLPLGLSYLPRTRWRASGDFSYTSSLGLGWKPW